jgi:hypothetical protein
MDVLLWASFFGVLAPHFGTFLPVQSNEESGLAISKVAQGPDDLTAAIFRRALRLLLPSFVPVWTAGEELVPTGGIKLEATNEGVQAAIPKDSGLISWSLSTLSDTHSTS